MSIRCSLGLHTWDWAHESIRLRGNLKVSVRECKHCGVRRGDTIRL